MPAGNRNDVYLWFSASEAGGGGVFQGRPGENDVHWGLEEQHVLSHHPCAPCICAGMEDDLTFLTKLHFTTK